MIKYLSIQKFLELIGDRSIVADLRKLDEKDFKELLSEFDPEKTVIEKQIGYIIDSNFKGKVTATGNFTPLSIGDIVIVKDETGQDYIAILEEVV